MKALFTRAAIWLRRRLCLKKLGSSFDSLETECGALYNALLSPEPCMISRFGAIELDAFSRRFYREMYHGLGRWVALMSGRSGPWWYEESVRRNMKIGPGFFPCTDAALDRFYERVKADCALIDYDIVLWPEERRIKEVLYPGAKALAFGAHSPFCRALPWTKALAGKKVLVVHPFVETIRSQYARRQRLFDNPDILPDFELLTYQPVVSNAETTTVAYVDWFAALDKMVRDIRKLDFDIAVIGAGAYGMNLAAEIKRMGKKAFHLGGLTQLLFGIKGHRWDDTWIGHELYNDFWVRPSSRECPAGANKVEGACYW